MECQISIYVVFCLDVVVWREIWAYVDDCPLCSGCIGVLGIVMLCFRYIMYKMLTMSSHIRKLKEVMSLDKNKVEQS